MAARPKQLLDLSDTEFLDSVKRSVGRVNRGFSHTLTAQEREHGRWERDHHSTRRYHANTGLEPRLRGSRWA